MNTKHSPCFMPDTGIKSKTMYAIAFDLDMDKLKIAYPGPSLSNAYKEIASVLAEHNFTPQQGSVYFGDMNKVNSREIRALCFPI